MDPNIAPKDTNSNQQNNQILLNAIKSKFDSQVATEMEAFSPPKFNIPLLKIPQNLNSNNKSVHPTKSTSQLNQFLLQQLQAKGANNEKSNTSTEFLLPQLQSSTHKNIAAKFEFPKLEPQSDSTNIGSLTSAINKLKVKENACDYGHSNSAAIDLTAALANKLQTHQSTPPTRDFFKPQQINDKLDFEIPFIDCDWLDVSRNRRIILPTSNEYCITDISQLSLHHSLTEPSAVGRFLCIDNKYLRPLPVKFLSPEYHQQRVRHNIEPFRFDTKSPDDVVLLALSKYKRPHYN